MASARATPSRRSSPCDERRRRRGGIAVEPELGHECVGATRRLARRCADAERGDLDVLAHREVAERAAVLERAGEAVTAAPMRRPAGDVAVTERDSALVGTVEAAEHVDERRLAGAVRPDQADDLAAVQLEGDAGEGAHALERTGNGGGPERRSGPRLRFGLWFSRQPAVRSSGRPWRRRCRRASGVLSWILITRYCRPNTVWYFAEKLTRPEIVGTFLNACIFAASTAPFVEPPARRIAVTTPSIAAGPVMKPPVPAFTCLASLFTAADRVVTEHRGEGDEPVVRDLRALRQPVVAVTGPRVEDRRVVAQAAQARDQRRERAERTCSRRHDHVRLLVVQPADGVLHVVAAERLVRLVGDDLAAELLEACLERLDDVLEVDDHRVGRERGRPPALPVGVLRHRRALVLGDVAVAERELALRAEALRAHLIGADARRDREHAAVDRLLHDRSREVDVARREHHVCTRR